MKWKVLVSAPYMQPVLDRFRHIFKENDIELVVPPVNERLSENELLKWIENIDGVICGDDHFTEQVLRTAHSLKVISKWGTGIDSIDQSVAAQLGIEIKNTPNAFSGPVADTVLGYILCFARQLPWSDQDIREGKWKKRPCISLSECTLGVIGMGNVGKNLVRKAHALGMHVLGNDLIEIDGEFLEELGVEMVSQTGLLEKSDFVSLNCDLNPTSFHLIGDRAFEIMKPTACIINTSRGSVINEPALVRALSAGNIAGAALDVFEEEPLPSDSPLHGFDNVLLAPHLANGSPAAWKHVHENTIQNLLECLKASETVG